MTYKELKEDLNKRFPYIRSDGKFQDGSEVTCQRINQILSDAQKSIIEIREEALSHLRKGPKNKD